MGSSSKGVAGVEPAASGAAIRHQYRLVITPKVVRKIGGARARNRTWVSAASMRHSPTELPGQSDSDAIRTRKGSRPPEFESGTSTTEDNAVSSSAWNRTTFKRS